MKLWLVKWHSSGNHVSYVYFTISCIFTMIDNKMNFSKKSSTFAFLNFIKIEKEENESQTGFG